MNDSDLRRCADHLWNGNKESVRVLGQLKQFHRFDEILYWLIKNNIRGERIVDFFNDAEGVETRGVLMGVKRIYNYIDNTKYDKTALTVRDLI